MPTQKEPSFVQASKHVKTPRTSVKPVEHPKQAENLMTDNHKSRGHKHSWNRKACFVCRSLNHWIKYCDFYDKQMVQKPVWNHAMRVNHQNSARLTHSHSNRHVVPTTFLTRSRLVPLTVARPVTTTVPQTTVKNKRPVKHVVNKIQVSHSLGLQKTLSFLFDIQGNPQQALKNKGVIGSGCSRHMTGNISYLSDFEEINGGYVTFGENPKGGKITCKGKIKIGKLDFDDVYFVKELKFNLFSVSQIRDKKNSVLFTDTECVVLSSDFKLPYENHVLLRVPRENNMYNVDLKMVQKKLLVQFKLNANKDEPQPSSDVGKKNDDCVTKESGIYDQEILENSTQDVNTAGPSINTVSTNVDTGSLNINTVSSSVTTALLEATHADFLGDETKVEMSNISTTYLVPSTPNTRIHNDHSLDQVIDDVYSGVQTRRMTKTTNE
nr:ribonuclease H-like domain-containing protein [Tanacetum cinerariifolium]